MLRSLTQNATAITSPKRKEEEVIRDAARHGMKEHGKTQDDSNAK